MIKILFVCHGNICRSPMAEYVMKHLVKKQGLSDHIYVESAATSREEIFRGKDGADIGNPVYPPARAKLLEHGIDPAGKTARQLKKDDYNCFDMIICMDSSNVRNSLRITGSDPLGKISMLLDHCGRSGEEVADPWYTGNFDDTWDDVLAGCEGLLEELSANPEICR